MSQYKNVESHKWFYFIAIYLEAYLTFIRLYYKWSDARSVSYIENFKACNNTAHFYSKVQDIEPLCFLGMKMRCKHYS